MPNVMSWDEWWSYDATALAELVESGKVTPAELAAQAAEGARLVDPRLDAVLELFDDVAIPPAPEEQVRSALHGVPFFMKDLGARLAGRKQEQGTAFHAGEVSPVTDPFAQNLVDAGMVPIGRSTVPPFGYTLDTTTTYRGRTAVTRTPWHPERTAGGSSGGSGALVAAGVVPISHATDGGGSIRFPGAFNALVGMKASRGRMARRTGQNEFVNHVSVDGFVSRTVRDSATAFNIAASIPPGAAFIQATDDVPHMAHAITRGPGRQLRVALSTGRWGADSACDAQVAERVREAGRVLQGIGHAVEEVADEDINDFEALRSAFRTTWVGNTHRLLIEADAAGLSRDALLAKLEPMVRAQFLAAERIDKFDIWRAMAKNPVTTRRFGEFFERYDVLVTPTAAERVPLANGPYSLVNEQPFEPWFDALMSIIRYTYPANECGYPSMTLPAGLDADGAPIGMLVNGSFMDEWTLFAVAGELERARPDWYNQKPPVRVGVPT